jgi:hypothetical protein
MRIKAKHEAAINGTSPYSVIEKIFAMLIELAQCVISPKHSIKQFAIHP